MIGLRCLVLLYYISTPPPPLRNDLQLKAHHDFILIRLHYLEPIQLATFQQEPVLNSKAASDHDHPLHQLESRTAMLFAEFSQMLHHSCFQIAEHHYFIDSQIVMRLFITLLDELSKLLLLYTCVLGPVSLKWVKQLWVELKGVKLAWCYCPNRN